MKLCRFGDNRFGLVRDDKVLDVSGALAALGHHAYPLPNYDLAVANLDTLRMAVEAAAGSAHAHPLKGLTLLSPIANPGKVVAAPVNYQKHFDEATAEPETFSRAQVRKIREIGLFLKASSSLVGPGEGLALRFPTRRTDHEVELAVVIGRIADRVPASQAFDYIAGYAIGLDMTTRGVEERSLRKSSDGYSVLGPWFVTADEIANPGNLDLELLVNGERRQSANTRDLILDIPALIEFASSFYTLHPGDILMTGTPEGVGPVQTGDVIPATIQGIGSMEVRVRAPDA